MSVSEFQVAKGTNVTSVWIAARNGHDKVVSTLLANGASARAAYMNNVSGVVSGVRERGARGGGEGELTFDCCCVCVDFSRSLTPLCLSALCPVFLVLTSLSLSLL